MSQIVEDYKAGKLDAEWFMSGKFAELSEEDRNALIAEIGKNIGDIGHIGHIDFSKGLGTDQPSNIGQKGKKSKNVVYAAIGSALIIFGLVFGYAYFF